MTKRKINKRYLCGYIWLHSPNFSWRRWNWGSTKELAQNCSMSKALLCSYQVKVSDNSFPLDTRRRELLAVLLYKECQHHSLLKIKLLLLVYLFPIPMFCGKRRQCSQWLVLVLSHVGTLSHCVSAISAVWIDQ